jgi:predicted secreted protein
MLRRLAERLRRQASFRDERSRTVIFVPHCALNQNARAAGAAERPAAVSELIAGLLEREIGIVQMPCPELCAFGLDRGQVRVEDALRAPAGRVLCRRLAREQAQQIQAYLGGGIRVLGILGKNGSPSCGVEVTWAGGVCPGPGAYMEVLAAELQARNLPVEMTGMRDSESTQALAVVDRWLTFVERRTQDQIGAITLGIAVLSLLAFTAGAGAQPAPSIATIVEFNTVCGDCHTGECSGRLSFDSGPAAARAHIERYLGNSHDVPIAALFAMLRHVKETCSHYPMVPLRPATGSWEASELAPWRNARAGAYFIPLGRLAAGRRHLSLEFDRPADGSAQIDDDLMQTVADERLCRDMTKTVELDATATATYFLHLKSGSAILSRIAFR